MGAYSIIKRGLFRLDPESAHGVAVGAARFAQRAIPAFLGARYRFSSERIAQELWARGFATPIGLAAGFDKNAELINFWSALGFGFAEVGSVSALPCEGNDRPRAFRLPRDRALINRMGLNNHGAEAVAQRLARRPAPVGFPIGINIAKTHDPEILGAEAIEDFCSSFRELARYADYIAVNVSCPNTAEGKTFEEPRAFDDLLAALSRERNGMKRKVPLLVKLSPPPVAPQPIPAATLELVEIALSYGVSGFIASNTASDRVGLSTSTARLQEIGKGGVSGKPLGARSSRLVRFLYRRLQGQVPIIGVGGVATLDDVLDKLTAGANLVELYTALVYEGPGVACRLARALDHWLRGNDHLHVSAIIGSRCDAD